MNTKTWVSSVRVGFSFLLIIAACAASAAVNEATTSSGGKSYSDSTMWAEGDYPDGRGAILNVGGHHTLGNTDATPALDKNVTLGAIRRQDGLERMRFIFYIPGLNHGSRVLNELDPMYGGLKQSGTAFGGWDDNVQTNTITLWNTGDEPAFIGSLAARFDETGSTKATVDTEMQNQFFMMIDAPLVLKSDLLLSHEGVVGCQIGWYAGLAYTYNHNEVCARPYAAISLGGTISTPENEFHDLIVSNPVYRGSALRSQSSYFIHNAVMLQGENTFKGDVRVKEGVLRLAGENGLRGEIHQLGDRDNKVYVSAEGGIDLMGGAVPATHHLYLQGLSASTTFGNLVSLDRDPLACADWRGPVTVSGEAAVGGYPTYIYSNSKWPLNCDGRIRISGAIDGAAALHVRGCREVLFAGDNSAYTGDLILEETGSRTRFLNDAALPTNGKLVFKGGVVRVGATTDGDISKLGAKLDTKTNSKPLKLDISEGVTYTPAQAFVNCRAFAKTGAGTLYLDKGIGYFGYDKSKNQSPKLHLEDGETVFDFTKGATEMWGEVSKGGDAWGTVNLLNDAKMTIKIPSDYDNHGLNTVCVYADSFARVQIETDSEFKLMNINAQQNGLLMFEPVAGTGSVLVQTGNSGSDGVCAPMGDNILWGETTFACRDSLGETYGTLQGFPDSGYATSFDGISAGAADSASSVVDVTADNVPDGAISFTNRILRFNTPAAGKEIVVNMTGFTNMVTGAILITPNLGDTRVIFRGGALTAANNGTIRIINLNTNANAYVEFACDLVGGAWESNGGISSTTKMSLLVAGQGRTVFAGRSYLNSYSHFVDCNIELKTNGLFANYNINDDCRHDMCANGARFLALADMTISSPCDVGGKTGNCRFEFFIGRGGMYLGAAENKELSTSKIGDCYFLDGGLLGKIGKGTLNVKHDFYNYGTGIKQCFVNLSADFPTQFPNEYELRGDLREGTVTGHETYGALYFFGLQPMRIAVADGVKLVGKSFCLENIDSGKGAPCDNGRRYVYEVASGATLTLDKASGATLELTPQRQGATVPFMLAKGNGLLAGGGTVILTDSKDVTKGFYPHGVAFPDFFGTLRADAPFISDSTYSGSLGLQLPNATLNIQSGQEHKFSQLYKDYLACRIGALTGAGAFTVTSVADSKPGYTTYLGCDDANLAAEFEGVITSNPNAARFVKVGKSTQKISNGENSIKGTTTVRDGTLLVGHAHALKYKEGSTFCYPYLIVGDDRTTAGMVPRLLADGATVISNQVRVLACADASVTPTVGVENGQTVLNDLAVSNNVKVVANAAGSKATISKLTMLDDCDVSVGGAGEVEFAGDVTLPAGVGASFGTTFTVGGKLTVGEGASFALSGLPDELDPEKTYTLVSAAGGIEGTFDFSGVTLPKNWVLRQKADKVVLTLSKGLMLIFR